MPVLATISGLSVSIISFRCLAVAETFKLSLLFDSFDKYALGTYLFPMFGRRAAQHTKNKNLLRKTKQSSIYAVRSWCGCIVDFEVTA